MSKHPLVFYFILTYLTTWGIAILILLFPEAIESIFGKIDVYNPLYFLAVYMPSLSALFIIRRRYGVKGCKNFIRRIIHWERGFKQFFFLILFFASYYILMRFVSPLWNAEVPIIPYKWYMFLPMMLFFLFADAGPIGEESGWSGLALPLLQRRFCMVKSGIILGILWALWHTPAFFIASLNQSAYNFLGFLFFLTCLRIFMVVIFNLSKGSILSAIVIHWFNNLDTYLHITGSSFISSLISGVVFLLAAFIIIRIKKPKPFKKPIPIWVDDVRLKKRKMKSSQTKNINIKYILF